MRCAARSRASRLAALVTVALVMLRPALAPAGTAADRAMPAWLARLEHELDALVTGVEQVLHSAREADMCVIRHTRAELAKLERAVAVERRKLRALCAKRALQSPAGPRVLGTCGSNRPS